MKTVTEKQVHGNISLSHTQKYVLAKLISSPTPLTAYESVSNGRNIVAARDQLTGLGLMQHEEGEAIITDSGMEAMREENLVDDAGQLTPEGEQYGYASSPEDIQKIAAQNKEPVPPNNPAENPVGDTTKSAGTGQQNPFMGAGVGAGNNSGQADVVNFDGFESLDMIRQIDTILKEEKFFKNIKKS